MTRLSAAWLPCSLEGAMKGLEQAVVSILVAAWNEAEHIDDLIASCLRWAYPRKELVLCAGGADDTLRRARRWEGAGVRVLEQLPGEGKQGALERCLREATGEIIVLTDADCVPS